MNLHEFTDAGMEEFDRLLEELRRGEDQGVTTELLTSPRTATDLGSRLSKIPHSLEDRFSLAVWLNRELDAMFAKGDTGTVGMWTWLTAYLLDLVAPPRAGGSRKIGERARYVLEADTPFLCNFIFSTTLYTMTIFRNVILVSYLKI